MKSKVIFDLATALTFLVAVGCQSGGSGGHEHAHSHEHLEHEIERGDHRGRLLREGNLALELQIFESGVPPQFRIYATQSGKTLPSSEFSASVLLKRLGGRTDVFDFAPVGDFLSSPLVVEEPHSFDVQVDATVKGVKHQWKFESYEGRTQMPDEVASRSGIGVEKAVSRQIPSLSRVRGKIVPSEERIAHIIPRYSGVVREARKRVGDSVTKGEVLAIIESNQSLQPYEVRSQITGTVISGHIVVGEYIPENQWVYIVADLSEVWADFFIPLREEIVFKDSRELTLYSVDGDRSARGVISYVAPYADEKSQSRLVRVVVANPDSRFLPGMFVVGDITVGTTVASVAVKNSALQSFRDWRVVFIKVGETYEARPLEVGVNDGEWTEVKSGLLAGEEYVSKNPYLIKADILKSGASHDH